MMKKITILCALLISIFVSAQRTINVDITWKNVVISTASTSFTVPGFDEKNFEYQDDLGILYTMQWDESAQINKTTARVSNVVYQNISRAELKDLATELVPKEIKFNIQSIQARNKRTGFLSLFPIIKEGSTFKKVVSFDIEYQTGANKSFAKKLPITNSVLATGNWYKFYVDKTGVFRITPAFLSSLGMDLSSVDPNTIKIYGNGGRMLPLINQDNTEFDLRENAIQMVGGDDGNFSGDDYILMYGENTEGYSEENITNINLYADKSYYYVTAGGSNGRRVSNFTEPTDVATTQINSFTDYQFYEVDEFNIVKVGRRWFGDRFDVQSNRNYDFNFPNLITTEPIQLRVFAAATSASTSSMNVTVNGVQAGVLSFSQVTGTSLGSTRELIQDITSNSDQVAINLNYNNNGNPAATGYLDFISLEAKRALTGTNSQMQFFYDEAPVLTGVGQYNITNSSSISQVWDVTNPALITRVANDNASSTLTFKANMGESRQYLAIVPTDYFDPIADQETRVDNQDIKGTVFLNNQGQFEDVDYLIISNNTLLQAANRLAEHHRNLNNYNVKVLSLDQIYQEFGSGKQDIVAIRNLIRYVYENASSIDERLKYVCFFGDASVDYKGLLLRENCSDSNIVPTFQSLSSFSLVSSFATDDFFGSMDPLEGRMVASDQLDIAVGRVLADTPQLADAMVSKIVNYDSEQSYGRWRNSVLLIADDVDVDWEETIQRNLDELGEELVQRKPYLNLTKIYADAFQQESSASGSRYPKVNEAISSAIETGAVAIDYFGHGGEDGLAKEFIFNKSDGSDLENTNRYPIFITVTCEFTKFDNPCRDTAGELTYWNTNGGAVGLISTTRDVIVTFGISVNDRLSEFLFPNGSDYPTVAEAVRQMKNSYTTNSRRVVFFFGDPAMKMAVPKPNVRLTSINDVPITQPVDTLKALSRIKVSGEVVNESGTLLSDYNGVLSTTIYDKEIDRETLANDNTRNSAGQIIKLNFQTLGEIIFRGKASVTNGLFDFEFIVPRDIGIPVDTGRISFYSSRNGVLENQTGVDQTILVGGLNENAPEDNVGPQIQLFMNDESFISGGVTNDSPILIAKLQDDNGINTASGIGHDISAILDGDESNPFILNDFYETEIDDFTNGVVNFKFKDLEPGLHTLTFKGWDVYNNSSTQEIQFVVADAAGFTLNNVLNYPNPFVSHTEFWFEHSSSISDVLEVQVQVFTVSGKVIWTSNQTLSGKTSYREDIQWNGRDDFGDKLGKGVYVYKISVKSTLTNQRVEKFEKLVIL
ncbi:type IX secretion system sortase PorU [Aquimarina sp. 2201CG14-23]|uniref:type IX secretion system sortase PorU n=1 Tax=Aquimarina mycalae TaxID=3040073 RepID=UPI00247807AF|nr:type IX secretion system sortase PorU [Aquimarina sp. 2201CG14-23]MDH7444886.1 type IX secretion system sortase PorU [Aquimarina sp. 2201CG14-23]